MVAHQGSDVSDVVLLPLLEPPRQVLTVVDEIVVGAEEDLGLAFRRQLVSEVHRVVRGLVEIDGRLPLR